MTERFIAGALTAIALSISTIVIALFITICRGGPGVPATMVLWSAIPQLLFFIAAGGFAIGAVLGPVRAVSLLSHLWGTAEPRNHTATVLLWMIFIALWGAAFTGYVP